METKVFRKPIVLTLADCYIFKAKWIVASEIVCWKEWFIPHMPHPPSPILYKSSFQWSSISHCPHKFCHKQICIWRFICFRGATRERQLWCKISLALKIIKTAFRRQIHNNSVLRSAFPCNWSLSARNWNKFSSQRRWSHQSLMNNTWLIHSCVIGATWIIHFGYTAWHLH